MISSTTVKLCDNVIIDLGGSITIADGGQLKHSNDVDLLATPSYTFEARTDDYASRFKLVFATGDADEDDPFAFISNGEIIVNGEGTLQVIDMLGHILLSRQITSDSCLLSSDFLPFGVYVLRLINGDDVKTQKMVIQ